VALVALLIPAFVLVYPGLVEYVSTGHVEMHWSRALLASLMVALVTVFGLTVFLLHMLDLIDKQLEGATASRPPERIHEARPRRTR
jgi:hypothetical protein